MCEHTNTHRVEMSIFIMIVEHTFNLPKSKFINVVSVCFSFPRISALFAAFRLEKSINAYIDFYLPFRKPKRKWSKSCIFSLFVSRQFSLCFSFDFVIFIAIIHRNLKMGISILSFGFSLAKRVFTINSPNEMVIVYNHRIRL